MHLPIVLGFSGYKLTSQTIDFLRNTKALGVMLFSNNIKDKQQLRELTLDLKNFDPEILIAIDFEGGLIHRFSKDIPVIASAKAMGKSCNWDKIEQNLEIMAQTLSFFDIDINFAPVLDIVNHETNQALENRGFFPDPQLIGYYNDIFTKAHQKYGVHTVAKHFPGLSKITQDPHTSCSVFEGTKQDLLIGLSCYQDFLEKQILFQQSVMTSHVIYPSLDDKLPVTFSPNIVKTYLRSQLQFQGVVFSDCLEMKASSKLYHQSQIAQKTLLANHDILISSGQIESSSFRQQLIAGLQDYLQKEPEKAMILAKKIDLWSTKIRKNRIKTSNLPDYSKTVQINKIFVQKKIYSWIEKITDFQFVAMADQKDIIDKFKEYFPNLKICNPSEAIELKHKTLVLVINDALASCKQLCEKITKLISLAPQTLIIAVAVSGVFNCDEEWILWGKNHLMLDALLELFREKQ